MIETARHCNVRYTIKNCEPSDCGRLTCSQDHSQSWPCLACRFNCLGNQGASYQMPITSLVFISSLSDTARQCRHFKSRFNILAGLGLPAGSRNVVDLSPEPIMHFPLCAQMPRRLCGSTNGSDLRPLRRNLPFQKLHSPRPLNSIVDI